MTVRDLMTHPVETAPPEESILEARRRFADGGFRHLPIVEDGRLLGVVSDRDLLRAAGPALGFSHFDTDEDDPAIDRPLREIMTRYVLTADPNMSVADAADTMIRQGLSALPVLDEDRLIGILTTADVLRLAADQAG